jgi:hypothetical protein
VSTEQELRNLTIELRRIRQALERLSPPPPKEDVVHEKRRVIVL